MASSSQYFAANLQAIKDNTEDIKQASTSNSDRVVAKLVANIRLTTLDEPPKQKQQPQQHQAVFTQSNDTFAQRGQRAQGALQNTHRRTIAESLARMERRHNITATMEYKTKEGLPKLGQPERLQGLG